MVSPFSTELDRRRYIQNLATVGRFERKGEYVLCSSKKRAGGANVAQHIITILLHFFLRSFAHSVCSVCSTSSLWSVLYYCNLFVFVSFFQSHPSPVRQRESNWRHLTDFLQHFTVVCWWRSVCRRQWLYRGTSERGAKQKLELEKKTPPADPLLLVKLC